MKVLVRFVLSIGVAIAALLIVAFVSPAEQHVSRSIEISAPPEKIFPLIHDLNIWPTWTAWAERDPDMRMRYGETSVGVGAEQFRDSESEGSGSLKIINSEAPRYLAYDLHIDGFDSISVGEFELEPLTNGTRVTWTDNIELSGNPLARVFGLFLDGVIGPDFESGLANLKQRVEMGG